MITSVIKILPKKGLLRGLIRDKGLEEENDSVPPELAYTVFRESSYYANFLSCLQ